jgi:hypothetical protein
MHEASVVVRTGVGVPRWMMSTIMTRFFGYVFESRLHAQHSKPH